MLVPSPLQLTGITLPSVIYIEPQLLLLLYKFFQNHCGIRQSYNLFKFIIVKGCWNYWYWGSCVEIHLHWLVINFYLEHNFFSFFRFYCIKKPFFSNLYFRIFTELSQPPLSQFVNFRWFLLNLPFRSWGLTRFDLGSGWALLYASPEWRSKATPSLH